MEKPTIYKVPQTKEEQVIDFLDRFIVSKEKEYFPENKVKEYNDLDEETLGKLEYFFSGNNKK